MSKRVTSGEKELSVIIPTHNSASAIVKVLESLLLSDYDKSKMEITVVDDASTDDTLQIIEGFKNSHGHRCGAFEVIQLEENVGTSRARNTGIEMSKGEYVFLLDSDVLLRRDTIPALMSILREDPKIGCASALYLTEKPGILEQTGYCRHLRNVNDGEIFTGAALIRREIIEKVGLFNEELGYPRLPHEDTEYTMRVRRAGVQIFLDAAKPLLHMKDPQQARSESSSGEKSRLSLPGERLRSYLTFRKAHALHLILKAGLNRYRLEWFSYMLLVWTTPLLFLVTQTISLSLIVLSLLASIAYYSPKCSGVSPAIRAMTGPVVLCSRMIRAFTLSVYYLTRLPRHVAGRLRRSLSVSGPHPTDRRSAS